MGIILLMKVYVVVIDGDWFEMVCYFFEVDEFNVWKFIGMCFFCVFDLGEFYFFKLYSFYQFIVGGGFFVYFFNLFLSIVWEVFGICNGSCLFVEMNQCVECYVCGFFVEELIIGCILLYSFFFFDWFDWIFVLDDFYLLIVQGKFYDFVEFSGEYLWKVVCECFDVSSLVFCKVVQGSFFGDLFFLQWCLGSGIFWVLVIDVYVCCCVVIGCDVLLSFDVVFICFIEWGGFCCIDNGVFFCVDFKWFFEVGYLLIDFEGCWVVSLCFVCEFDVCGDVQNLYGKFFFWFEDLDYYLCSGFFEWY